VCYTTAIAEMQHIIVMLLHCAQSSIMLATNEYQHNKKTDNAQLSRF